MSATVTREALSVAVALSATAGWVSRMCVGCDWRRARPSGQLATETDKVESSCWLEHTKENDRAHARRCGLEETSCPRRQAAAEQGRRGTRARWCGNKGRAAPVVRHESERHQCRCARRRPAYCWGIQQVISPANAVYVLVLSTDLLKRDP